ncbi:FecR domain-containing protein [Chitinophaga sp. NPDC101104]|uniref:FecR domain-containing protein n=1 Tax=Chitinophaga sp. NPDC101104 TaxID=3390561 RepID=UPI003D023171
MDKRELIRKFLNNECNREEAAIVEEYLASDPGLLHTFLPQEEWEQSGNAAMAGDTALKQEIWQPVEAATRKRTIHRRLYTAVAIAASILLLITAGAYFSNYFPSAPYTAHVPANAASLVAQNHSETASTFRLPDGSTVTLYPNTTLRYSADFTQNRTVHLLSGKAIFDVATDPVHPFTVYSANIATTALGTRFLVDHSQKTVNVQLYEGKVMVKYLSKNAQVLPAVLLPGEQCFVNLRIDGIAIAPVKTDNNGKAVPQGTLAAGKASMLSFDNVPLNDAFDILGGLFHQRIIYNTSEMERMYFTGRFSVSDSLSSILHIFTAVNGLAVENADGGIRIVKAAQAAGGKPAAGPGEIQYSGTSLEALFSEMEMMFHVKIRYNREDIAHKYFTGTISPADDAAKMLAVICRMNQLQVIKDSTGFRIMSIK